LFDATEAACKLSTTMTALTSALSTVFVPQARQLRQQRVDVGFGVPSGKDKVVMRFAAEDLSQCGTGYSNVVLRGPLK
jgi:hypothetical protein